MTLPLFQNVGDNTKYLNKQTKKWSKENKVYNFVVLVQFFFFFFLEEHKKNTKKRIKHLILRRVCPLSLFSL